MKIDAVVHEKKHIFMPAGSTLNFILPAGASGQYNHLFFLELTLYCSCRRLVVK